MPLDGQETDTKAIEAALDEVRPGLDVDGFDLRILAVEPGGDVRVALEARRDACFECLVPDEILLQIVESAIRRSDPEVGGVVLEKLGFEGTEAPIR